mmetsp:Transcript_36636/g.46689  ORF Transcript_36636/g.46689 Transcript_36636/m.46689 type:complete len:744 (+) Transcript_36636:264-2495(+)|eukprot:CAMPEP_0117744896 /NCGR_PEP_ID=MMETSP0947-20121206/7035_1 /TAXON_ID=44440 /ORGANISM="Chattonella subsalsa, Strain CCMP2191" /LENGTH=743 /DNA_ID=CAMNT_0005561939 /DNA_START=167 /DNA_END=2398 /DNA_ORIENTATION=-
MASRRKKTNVEIFGFGLNFYHQLGIAVDGSLSSRRRPLTHSSRSASQPGLDSPTRGLVKPTGTPTKRRSRQNTNQEDAKEDVESMLVTERLAQLDMSREVSTESGAGIGTRALMPVKLDLEAKLGEGEGNVEEVACGANFSVALTTNGSLYRWGMDNGKIHYHPAPVPTGIPLRCTQVTCGRKHTVALMEGGFVMSWGVGYFGQLGHGDNISYSSPKLVHRLDPQRLGGQVIQVGCGGYHSAALTDTGYLFMWGFNRYGQCGNGQRENTVSDPAPCQTQTLAGRKLRQLSLGRHHSAVLTNDGQVLTWGSSSFGRLGLVDPEKCVCAPRPVLHLAQVGVAAIASGDFHMLALTQTGKVYSWGYGAEGQCGHGSALHLRTPRVVEYLGNLVVTRISAGAWWSMAVTGDGELYSWGCADGGWTGLERPIDPPVVEPGPNADRYGPTCCFDSYHNALLPELVEALAGYKVLKVSCGGSHSFVFVEPATPISSRRNSVNSRTEVKFTTDAFPKDDGYNYLKGNTSSYKTKGDSRQWSSHSTSNHNYYSNYRKTDSWTSKKSMDTMTADNNDGSVKPEASLSRLGTDFSSLPQMVVSSAAQDKSDIMALLEDAKSSGDIGADSQEEDKDAYNAYVRQVFSCCRHNRIEEVHQSLESGFPINTRDENGSTLLMIAAQNGLRQMARLCLRYRAEINDKNNRGNTALHFCFGLGNTELGEYLISKGGDDTILNDEGLTCYEGTSRAALDAL